MNPMDQPSIHANERALFKRGISALKITLMPRQIEQLHQFYLFFKSKREILGLTSLSRSTEIIPELFVDSLALVPLLHDQPSRSQMIDIGTGAGFPGIPLKIACPWLSLTLLDTSKKKLGFCHLTAMKLGLDHVVIREGRAEEAGHDPLYRERFDLVCIKAVAGLPTLLEYGLPFLKDGGLLAAYKGPETHSEIESAQIALAQLNGKILSNRPYSVGSSENQRSIVIVEKLGRIDDKYPRKPDLPKKTPL